METKPIYLSKTVWANVILAAAAFIPAVNEYLQANPEILGLGFALVNTLLRLITKDKVELF